MPDRPTPTASPADNLPARVQESELALSESRELLKKSFSKAMLTNLAIMACTGMFAIRSTRLFWEKRGKRWTSDLKEFSTKAYKAIKQDAFGSDETIETLQFMDALPPSDSPQLPEK
jgi:hypothetical protein